MTESRVARFMMGGICGLLAVEIVSAVWLVASIASEDPLLFMMLAGVAGAFIAGGVIALKVLHD